MKYFWIAILLIIGNAFGWYATNIQFFMDYWKDKPVLSTLLFGIPSGLIYWYAKNI